MFNNGDSAEIEWIIERGGIEFDGNTCAGIVLMCEKCKCRAFKTPIDVSRKNYYLHEDGAIETNERFKTVCNQCGLTSFTEIITYIGPNEEHPRRKLLERAKYDSLCLDPSEDQ